MRIFSIFLIFIASAQANSVFKVPNMVDSLSAFKDDEGKQQIAENARREAIRVTHDVFRQYPRKGYRKIIEQLKINDIKLAGRRSACRKQNVGAYTFPNSPKIHVCDYFFEFDLHTQAYIMIHETVHTVGIRDECEADRWAYRISKTVYPERPRSAYNCPEIDNVQP